MVYSSKSLTEYMVFTVKLCYISEKGIFMANMVRYIQAIGIHGRFDLELDFDPGVNILYGKNGTGKTTLLHIIANILNGDFERFAFLPFEMIEIILDDGQKIKLVTSNKSNSIEVSIDEKEVMSFDIAETKEKLKPKVSSSRAEASASNLRAFQGLKPILSTAYFPAFRTLIEASNNEIPSEYYFYVNPSSVDRDAITPTVFARRFFGDFVPWINYPSPQEVSRKLSREMQQALNSIASIDRELLSKAFLDIFATLSKESNANINSPEQILENIKSLLSRLDNSPIINDPSSGEEVYSKLRELVLSFKVRQGTEAVPILEVYKSSLEERANIQEKSQKTIKTYLDSVNRFLDDKSLVFRKAESQVPILQVEFRQKALYSKIEALSSGERQIVTLIYSATHMSGQKVVLIDEPEISLHIDWQSLLIPEMVAQLHDRQIITCTHSPMVGAEYEDQMVELEIRPTSVENTSDDATDDIIDDIIEDIEEAL
jgi:predicted ATP-binding protein involved in virulence